MSVRLRCSSATSELLRQLRLASFNDRIFLIDPDFVSLCTLNGRNFLEEDLPRSATRLRATS